MTIEGQRASMKKSGKHRNRGHLTKAEAEKAVKAIEVDGKPIGRVMRELNYAESTSNGSTKVLQENPLYVQAKNTLQDAIIKRNSTIFDKTARVIDKGLDAKITKFFAHEGHVIETTNCVDYPTRLKYVEVIADVFGFRKIETSPGVTFNISQLVMMIKQAEHERGLPT